MLVTVGTATLLTVVSVPSVMPVGKVWKLALSTILVDEAAELGALEADELESELDADEAAELPVELVDDAVLEADELAAEDAAELLAEDAVLEAADELAALLATEEDEVLDAEEDVVAGVFVELAVSPPPLPPQPISSRLVANALTPPFTIEFPAFIVMLLPDVVVINDYAGLVAGSWLLCAMICNTH